MDFYKIIETEDKKGNVTIYPEFKIGRSKDLMIRGKKFYAIWDEAKGLWSTDEYDVQRLVDDELWAYKKNSKIPKIHVKTMSDFSTNSWLTFRNYVGHVSDNSHELDCELTFSNTEVKKTDYISRRLSYPLEEGTHDAYDEIIGTLYSEEERRKLEWAIGAVVAGEAKHIQKFLVLYGDAGAGKSTILNVIQKLFESYYTIFEAKELTAANNSFATGSFKTNPLVAIQHDGDLSKIEDNTKLNSIVSHEELIINEKYETRYTMRINCFLFMATNKPVKITDAKSGIIRRLIDVRPSGKTVPTKRYNALISQIDFELGAIAHHCLKVFQSMGKNYYNAYRPVDMMYKTDPFFNFVEDSCEIFKEQNSTTLKAAYSMYKEYCELSGAEYKLQMYKFREELKNYFEKFDDSITVDDKFIRSYYSGFIVSKFERDTKPIKEEKVLPLILEEQESIFDSMCSDCPAQYATATENEVPIDKWIDVKKTLSDINTHKVHYVKVPENHIVIDFDIKDETGKKSFEKNLEAASKWPLTYTELSKGGQGIHLHYIYTGNITHLSRLYDENIEVKVFTGNSSLRRKLTKCNHIPVATISSGLPLKQEGDKVVNFDGVKTERSIRASIKKGLNKEVHPGTKSSIDFIYKVLDDAYKDGTKYDITDMRPAISAFAAKSTNQALYCIKLVNKMKFKSEEASTSITNYSSDTLVFYDVEVFPNVFIVCWKKQGDSTVVRMINPSPMDIEEILKFKLVGFNCRRYDNHIMYAKMMGYSNEQLYNLSQRIISNSKNALFGEAYNLSYTDVYDFASAGNKKSLKKFEIELGLNHVENSYAWDKDLPKECWNEVADYCCNDVVATESVFDYLSGDWTARQILAVLADLTVNDTTNTLTTRIIFGKEKRPQSEFNYRDLSKPVQSLDPEVREFLTMACPKMMSQTHYGWNLENQEEIPFGFDSLLPYFPGYKFELGKSTYRNTEVGEGGEVYAEPGMYGLAALLDVISMHPHSGIAECIFGVRFTTAFRDIVEGRVSIKHEAWDIVNSMLNGKLTPFIQKVINGEMTAKQLADALKTAINSVYGLTSASFDNPFRDKRNVDNIMAKRGALFMIDLRYAVQAKGFVVAHIKTDSIKIPNATPDIIQYVMDFGERYGYSFEHEATYEKICLVNNAVYIAKYATPETCQKLYGYIPGENKKHSGEWTATGTQFAVPYVFKTLFSKEQIVFEDLCETKSVTTALYLDLNEDNFLPEDDHNYRFVGKIGNFCPIKSGYGGGELLRIGQDKEGNIKYSAATGSKGYRWLESEIVKTLGKEKDIDRNYYINMVDDAVTSISQHGDFEWFVSSDPYVAPPFVGGRVL